MDLLSQSALLVAVTAFALGFSVLARNVRNKLFLAFAGLCTLISGWAASFFLERVWPGGTFYRLHLLANVWLGPASLEFIRVMIRLQSRFSRRLLDASILMGLLLSVGLALKLESYPWVLQVAYFSPGFVVIQILQLMWIDRRVRKGARRLPKPPTVGFASRHFIYLGALLVLATSSMDHISFSGKIVPSLGNFALTVYLFFISQAISQQRLLNFSALLSRILVLAAMALTLTIVYSLLVAWIQNNPILFFLNSFIVSLMIVLLLEPLRALVRYLTGRLLTQEHRKLEQTLREAQGRLTGIVERDALVREVLLIVEQTLQPQWAAFFSLRSDGTKYRRIRAVGEGPLSQGWASSGYGPSFEPGTTEAIREVLAENALLRHCEHLHSRGQLPILLDQILENEIDRSASRLQRENLTGLVQALKALGCNLLIPLLDSNQILGFVIAYVAAPPEPWGNNWGVLPVIYPYFEQAATTLRNMEVYVRSREKERLAALGEMAAGLAHEIRNPLGAIKGAAQFLDPSGGKPESRFLGVIVEEVDRLNRVVTQFLDYSKPYAAEFKRMDVVTVARKTVELLQPSLRPGLKLEAKLPGAPVPVQGSPEQIQQVLLNLLQNSFKALDGREDGVVRLVVDLDGRQKQVLVTVEDNGPGIRKENLEKIFIPFYTTSPSGTGLGLPICQRIIESHRGRIDVATEEGRFTRFSVVLPLAFEGA